MKFLDDPRITPMAFLLHIMRMPKATLELRTRAAAAVLPYLGLTPADRTALIRQQLMRMEQEEASKTN